MNIILRTRELASSKFVLALSLAVFLFPFLVLYRYKSGLNYLPVHIEVDGKQDAIVEVWCQSQFGNWGKIEIDNRYPNRWRQHEIISGIRRLCIVKDSHFLKEAPKINVKTGESWKIANSIPCEIVAPTAEIRTQFPHAAFVVEFASLVPSTLNAARNTINWQGDLHLLLVPFGQSLLLATILFSPSFALSPQKTAPKKTD